MEKLQKLTTVLRIVLGPSWRTSLLGYLGAGLIEAAASLTAPSVDPKWHVLALIVAAFGRAAKDSAVSGASSSVFAKSADEAQELDRLKAGQGFINTWLAVLLALVFVAGILVATSARADDPAPPLGGTFKVGRVQASYGPRLLPGMLALDFKSGDVQAVAIGGLAYGVDFWADQPYAVGFAAFLGAQTGSPAAISTGAVVTLFHYAVVGWHHGVTGGVRSDHLVVGPSVAF